MKKSHVIKRTKYIAKQVMAPVFFRLIFLLVLETITAFALSSVFAGLTEKLGAGWVVSVWVFRIDLLAILLSLLAGLFLLPLSLGITEYLLKLVRRREARIADIFLWFADGEKLKRVFQYFLYTVALAVLTVPLYTVPSSYLLSTANAVLGDFSDQLAAGLAAVSLNWSLVDFRAVGVCAVLLLAYALLSVKLLLTQYYFIDDDALGPFSAAYRSWQVMRGHALEFILLALSFIGWYIACSLTVFIVALYLLPYLRMSVVIFTEYVRADHELNRSPSSGGTGDGEPADRGDKAE